MRSTPNIQEKESDYSSMKEHEKKKIRENTDFEPSSLRWIAIGRDPNEAEASDNNARFINIQTKENHPFGKFSTPKHHDYFCQHFHFHN